MDGSRFDGLVKALTSRGGSRRAVLRGLAGGALGAALAGAAPAGSAARRRCKRVGAPCASDGRCCSRTCDFAIEGGTCAPCRGRPCTTKRDCCGRLDCTAAGVGTYCGGCKDRGDSCGAPGECCFSDCVSNLCLSDQGGPCARDIDCRACYFDGHCAGACVVGACTA